MPTATPGPWLETALAKGLIAPADAKAAAVPAGASEEKFQAEVVRLAKWAGWYVFHPHDSRRSTSGYPDLTLVRGSVLLFVELKKATGRFSAAQEEWLRRLSAVPGVKVRRWRPADMKEIERELLADWPEK